MTAMLQLSGAKRTYLLAKISSNLRPRTLQRRRARNLGWSGKITCPRPMLPLQRWRESAAGPTTLQGQTTQQTHSPQMSCVVRSEAASCWQAQRSDYRPLISGSQVRALNCPPSSLPKLNVERVPAETPIFGWILAIGARGLGVSVRGCRLQGTFGASVSGGKNPIPGGRPGECGKA
jgi:hypothetical protein